MKRSYAIAMAFGGVLLISVSTAHAAPFSFGCGCINANDDLALETAVMDCDIEIGGDRIRPAKVGDTILSGGGTSTSTSSFNGCDAYVNAMPSCITSDPIPLEAYSCVGSLEVTKK